MKRLILPVILGLALLATPVRADDASLLGPSSTSGPSTTTPSSQETANTLQPNSSSTLQQNSGASLGGSSGDAQTNLQQVGGQDAFKLYVAGSSEFDGSQQQLDDSKSNNWIWIVGLVISLGVVLGAAFLIRRRQPTAVASEPVVPAEEPKVNPKKTKAKPKSRKKKKASKRK